MMHSFHILSLPKCGEYSLGLSSISDNVNIELALKQAQSVNGTTFYPHIHKYSKQVAVKYHTKCENCEESSCLRSDSIAT